MKKFTYVEIVFLTSLIKKKMSFHIFGGFGVFSFFGRWGGCRDVNPHFLPVTLLQQNIHNVCLKTENETP